MLVLIGCALAIELLGTDIIFLLAVVLIIIGVLTFIVSYLRQRKAFLAKVIADLEKELSKLEEDFANDLINQDEYLQKKELLEVQIELERRKATKEK